MTPAQSHLAITFTRMEALKAALDAQPNRIPDVEFQYDRVLRSLTKLERVLDESVRRSTSRNP